MSRPLNSQETFSWKKILQWNIPWLLLLCVMLCYQSNLTGPFVYDDIWQILPALSSPESYQPFAGNPLRLTTRLTFWLNLQLLSENPNAEKLTTLGGQEMIFWHLANIFLHTLCALALFFFSRRCLFAKKSLLWPTATALIFAAHPLNSEAVNYIQARAVILLMLLLLSHLWISLHKPRALIWLSLTALLCLGAKEVALFFLPASYGVCYLLGLDPTRPFAKSQRRVLLAGFTLVVVIGLGFVASEISTRFSSFSQWWVHLQQQSAAYFEYWQLFLWPVASSLSFDHTLSEQGNGWFLLALLGLLVLSIVASVARKKLSLFPLAAALLWWNMIFLLPYFLIPTRFAVVEYRAYPFTLTATLLVVYILSQITASPKSRVLVSVLLLLLVASCCYQTYQRSQVWQSALTLYQDAYQKGSSRWPIEANLANAFLITGKVLWQAGAEEPAEKLWQQGRRMMPKILQNAHIPPYRRFLCAMNELVSYQLQGKILAMQRQIHHLKKFLSSENFVQKQQCLAWLNFLLARNYHHLGQIAKAKYYEQKIDYSNLPPSLRNKKPFD